MKQKQVKGAANGAKNAKTNKKEVPPKKVQEVVEENDEEEEEVVTKKAAVAKKPGRKPANKKGVKAQKVEEEPEPEEEVEEEEEEQEQENEDVEDDEEEQEAEDDEDVEDGDDDEEMEAGDDEEDPTLPSQVKSGEISSNVLNSKVIHISKLPKKCKTIDITEAFAKYGAIDQIHLVTTPGGAVANLVFKTEKGAKAALDAKNSIKVLGSSVKMSLKKEKKLETNLYDLERGIYIRNLKNGTTEEEIKEHFSSCGEIETVKCMSLRTLHTAYVVFKDKSSVAAALKLHNSILNDVHILVVSNTPDSNRKWTDRYVEKRTIKVGNKQQLENVESKKLETVLKKFGPIENLDILCSNNILAMVTYATEEAAEKALQLNGTTVKDIEFEVEYFHPNYKTSIFVSNLPRDCTKEDLEEFFSKVGEISSIYIKKPGVATIRFKDSDGYCKSFLYHESRFKGNYISISPFSYRKQTNNHHNNKRNNFKRGAGPNNDRVFRPKKPRNHL